MRTACAASIEKEVKLTNNLFWHCDTNHKIFSLCFLSKDRKGILLCVKEGLRINEVGKSLSLLFGQRRPCCLTLFYAHSAYPIHSWNTS